MNSEYGSEQHNSSLDALKQRQKASQAMPTLTGQQANILYTMPIQTVERLEQVLRSTLALQENIRSEMDSLATLVEPDGGSPSGDVPGPGESPAWDSGGEPTGWEAARRIYEAALRAGGAVPQELGRGLGPLPGQDPPDTPGIGHPVSGGQRPDVAAASVTEQIVHLLARLEDSTEAEVIDATARPRHGDRKALAKEQAKKIAMGHKADDHEEGQQMG